MVHEPDPSDSVRRRSRARRIALLLGCVLAAPVALVGLVRWKSGGAASAIEVDGRLADLGHLLAAHAGSAKLTPVPGSEPPFFEEPIPEALARQLFPQLVTSARGVVYDPSCYYRFRGGIERTIPFVECPAGSWRFRTNSLGLREDEELAEPRPRWSVLVAGDSQTEGYCDNNASFPNQLEASLAEELGADAVEVLNTGKSGYHFYNELGVLERFRERRPDVFVMALYAGNDFAESLALVHWFRRSTLPFCERCERQSRRVLADPDASGSWTQLLRQAVLFRHHPEQRALALEAACSAVAEAQRRSTALGTRFLLLVIPPARDAQPGFFGASSARLVRELELGDEDLAQARGLTQALLEFAHARAIECIDLQPLFRNTEARLYWERDLHLDVEGNRLVAQALSARIRGFHD